MGYASFEQHGIIVEPDGSTRKVITTYRVVPGRGPVMESVRAATGGGSEAAGESHMDPGLEVPSQREGGSPNVGDANGSEAVAEPGIAGSYFVPTHKLVSWQFFKDHCRSLNADLPTGEAEVVYFCPNNSQFGYSGSAMVGYVDDFDMAWLCQCGQWVKFTWSPTFAEVPDPRKKA